MSGSAFQHAKRLDKGKVSERDLVRGLKDTVKEFEPEECIAMLVKLGFNEAWLLMRLKQADQTSERAYKDLQKHFEDGDDTDDLWDDLTRSVAFVDALDLWVDTSGADNAGPFRSIFNDANKKTTPALERLLKFADAGLLEMHLTAQSFSADTFKRGVRDYLRDLRKSNPARAKAITAQMLDYVLADLQRHHDWATPADSATYTVYTLPRAQDLELFTNGDWKKAEDYGASDSLLAAMNRKLGTMSLAKNGSARFVLGASAYEGVVKESEVSLTARRGGLDRKLVNVKTHADGMIGEGQEKVTENRTQA
ncbi:MAG: hypothetical protein KDB07_00975, partial [Planctomycetes bacterium]|nr:hypothetical protein [Planctomycetota bacterium]